MLPAEESDEMLFVGKRISLVFLLLFAVGCRAQVHEPIEGKITIKGSNTFGAELAGQLISEYHKQQPKVDIVLESTDSASGFAALLTDKCDVAAASRVPNDEETRLASARGIELNGKVVGCFGIAVIVNGDNPVTNLSQPQIRDIFTGATDNWKAVGGPDSPIHVFIGDSKVSFDLGFRDLATEHKAYSLNAKKFTDYPQLAEAVSKDPQAIGYVSMGLADSTRAKVVSIEHISPNTITVNEGVYPYKRLLRLYTDKSKETPAAKDFIYFIQSTPGQDIVEKVGFVRRLEKRI